MTATMTWLETYRGGKFGFALVFDGVPLVAHTMEVSNIGGGGIDFGVSPGWSAAAAPFSDWDGIEMFVPGLDIVGSIEQAIELFSPEVQADSLSFRVQEPSPSTLNLYTSISKTVLREASNAGHKTYLTSSVVAGSTAAINVKDTTNFAASGYIYIGDECIFYTGKTATTFTGITRGKFTLYTTDGGTAFGASHTIGKNVTVTAATSPAVTDYPRTWYGRGVHLLMFHRDPITGVWCSPVDARVIWRGRIQSYRDNGDGSLTINARGAVDILQRNVGGAAWSADLGAQTYFGSINGVYNSQLVIGNDEVTAYSLGTRLTAGLKDHSALAGAINAQFEAWRVAGAPYHAGDSWSLNLQTHMDGSPPHYSLTFRANTTAITAGKNIAVAMSADAWRLLGFNPGAGLSAKFSGDRVVMLGLQRISSSYYTLIASEPPIAYYATAFGQGQMVFCNNAIGDYVAQQPVGFGAPAPCTNVARVEGAGDGLDGIYCVSVALGPPIYFTIYGKLDPATGTFKALTERADYGHIKPIRLGDVAGPPRISIVPWARGPAGQVLLKFLLSTGGATYNHAIYDVYSVAGMGAGVPASLIDLDTWGDLDEVEITVALTEPTPFYKLLEPVLAVANRYVVWRANSQTAQPKLAVPRPELDQPYQATWPLTESNKAGLPGEGAQRTTVERVAEGLINRIRFEYGKGLDSKSAGTVLEVNDIASQSDYGRKRTIKIDASIVEPKSVEKMAPEVSAPMLAYLSRPLAIAERSYNASLIRMAPGDAVSLTDSYVLGPRSGVRGGDVIYGWVLSTAFDFRTGIGTVRVVFLADKDPSYIGKWSPSARVDDAAAGAGYNAGTKTLTLKTNYYSSSGETADALRFSAGDKVHVYALDESAPLEWYDTIASTPTSTTITLTTGLAGYNTAKRYVIEYDDASTVVSGQRTSAFIADDADLSTGYVSNPRAYEWGIDGSSSRIPLILMGANYTIGMPQPNTTYDDKGEPLSVHKLYHVAEGLNQILGYKSCSTLLNQITTGGTGYPTASSNVETIVWVGWVPLYGAHASTGIISVMRGIRILMRGYVDAGATATFAVYTCSTPPIGTPTAFSLPGGGGSSSRASTTTTSTTGVWLTELSILQPAAVVYQDGMWGTWVVVTAKTGTAGKNAKITNLAIAEVTL